MRKMIRKKNRHISVRKDKPENMKKAMQNTGATALLISFAGLGGVLDQGASPVNPLMLAFIGIICCLSADRLQEIKKKKKDRRESHCSQLHRKN